LNGEKEDEVLGAKTLNPNSSKAPQPLSHCPVPHNINLTGFWEILTKGKQKVI
jgi:hypothetical protein